MEVWYSTITEPRTGTGLWLHHELVAPVEGHGDAYRHGWISLFPPDAPATTHRFGPTPVLGDTPAQAPHWFDGDGITCGPGTARGKAGDVSWDLHWTDDAAPLFTFPRVAWERELLPGAQVVPAPTSRWSGALTSPDGSELTLAGAPGNTAHIYGHGNALRWVWLHADLSLGGGRDGDVLEVVAAVSKKPGLNRLPPLAFVRLRADGRDWPAKGLPLVRGRVRIGLPTWTVEGRSRDRRIAIEVRQPEDRNVAVDYTDPDGDHAVCTNTERADAHITTWRRSGSNWLAEHEWRLDATAHAEVGLR